MKLSDDQVLAMAAAIGLPIPPEDLPLVTKRLLGILEEMEAIEVEYGRRLDDVDPVPSLIIDEDALR